MPINLNLKTGIKYVPFDFEKYVQSLKEDSSLFASFKYFNTVTDNWLELLRKEDERLKDNIYLEKLSQEEESRRKAYVSQNKKQGYEVFDHQLDFNCGESFVMHYDIEKIHASVNHYNIEPVQIDITNPLIKYNQTEFFQAKVNDNTPIFISFTPLINNPYTVIDGNKRCTAKVAKGITVLQGYTIENATTTLMFEIDKLFYKFLYEMHLIHIQLSMGEKNHKKLWKNSFIYRIVIDGGIEDYNHNTFDSYIKRSYENINSLDSKKENNDNSFKQRIINLFKRS